MENSDDAQRLFPASTSKYGAIEKTSSERRNKLPKTTTTKTTTTKEDAEEEPQHRHSIAGILFIMLGAFSFSVMFLIVKLMSNTNTFTLVFYRSLLQIAISLGSLIFFEKEPNPLGPPETRVYLVLRGIFGAIAVCAWFFGIQILPLPDAVTLQFTTPPFAAAFAVCLVGEAWLPLDIIGAIVCLTGVAFIAHPTWLFGGGSDYDGDDTDPDAIDPTMKALAVLVTTGGAASAGVAYVLVRKIGERASANVMVLYYGALSMPLLFIGSGLLVGDWDVWNGIDWTPRECILLILMGLGGYGGQFFTNLGLQRETAATGTLATSTQIVWTYVFELLFLHEGIDPFSLAGTALIMGYMLMVALMKMIGGVIASAEGANRDDNSEQTALLSKDDDEPEPPV